MPTAERRAKIKQAKQRDAIAKAQADRIAAAEDKTEGADGTGSKTQREMRSVATQTSLEAPALAELIQRYWQKLDARGIDQVSEPYQFIVGTSSGLRKQDSQSACDAQSESEAYDLYDYCDSDEINSYLEAELASRPIEDKTSLDTLD